MPLMAADTLKNFETEETSLQEYKVYNMCLFP